MLAAIKIEYEYAVEKLGKQYAIDEDACVLRVYLNAGNEGYKVFSVEENEDMSVRCYLVDAFIEISEKVLSAYKIMTEGNKDNYMYASLRI